MPAIKVLYGHELSDLCDEERIFDAADLNGIGITDALTPGVTLSVPVMRKRELGNETVLQIQTQVAAPKIIAGQTWVDLVLQQLGDEERLFELCDANSNGITEDLIPGNEFVTLEAERDKQSVVNTLIKTKPSSLYFGTGNAEPGGIEYWAIEIDFEVS